jgi:hypothetical protein
MSRNGSLNGFNLTGWHALCAIFVEAPYAQALVWNLLGWAAAANNA